MAEVALGIAGSVVGIVSLAGQVCAGIQELYAFLDSVKDSELDMKGIKDDINLLQNVIQWIHQDLTKIPEDVDATLFRTSLELCNSRITRLLAIVRSSETADHRNKTFKRLQTTAKKKRIVDFMRDLDSAKMSLILVHQHYIRESALRGTVGGASYPATAEMRSGESFIKRDPTGADNSSGKNHPMHIRRPNPVFDTDTTDVEYQILLGTLSIKTRSSRPITRNSDSTSNTQHEIETKTFKLQLAKWLASFNVELQALRRWGTWTYQLRHWRVINADSLLFELCKDGDLKNIQRLLGERLASPFDVSPEGRTVLHYAARSGHLELVSFFLQLGADANAETTNGESAFQYAMWSPREENHLELARLFVTRGQVDPIVSGSQYGIIHSYEGTSEAFEYMIKQDQFFVSPEERNQGGKTILHHQILHRLYDEDSLQRIEVLLTTGHHVNGSRIMDIGSLYSQFDGYTALQCAVERWSHFKITKDESTAQRAKLVVQSLLERGENIHSISSGRRFTPLTTIGEMIYGKPRSSQVEVLSEWLDILSKAGYEPNEYLLTEAKLERERPDNKNRLPLRLIFEEENGRISPQIIVSSSDAMVVSQDDQVLVTTEEISATKLCTKDDPNSISSALRPLHLPILSHYAHGLLALCLLVGLNVSPALTLLVMMLGFCMFMALDWRRRSMLGYTDHQ